MMVNRGLLGAFPVAVLTAALSACSHTPAAYERPTRTYKKEPAQAAVANMQLALEYMKLGKLATARECIEKALSQDSSNPFVQETAGLVYERVNEMGEAEHAYETAVRLVTHSPHISNAFARFLSRTAQTAAGDTMLNQHS